MTTFVMALTPDVPGFDAAVIAATNASNGTISMLANDAISLPTLATAGPAGKLRPDGAPLACDYFDALIDKWIRLDPDVWMGTASTYNFDLLVCMHRRGYHPRAGMWNFIAIGPATVADAWHYSGLLTVNGWDPYANFSDSVFTSTQVFAQQIRARYNFTALSYEAQMAVTGTMIVEAIKQTQSLDPFVIREALVRYSGSTVANVNTSFVPYTQQTAQSRLCFQAVSPTLNVATWPPEYANYRNITYPWKFEYDQAFLESLRRLSPRDTTLVLVFSITGGLALIGGIIALSIYAYRELHYHTVRVPKSGANPEWGSPAFTATNPPRLVPAPHIG
jgi:hypothetical protein